MSEPYIGEIRLFPYSFAPEGWFDCDGRQLSIAQYDALFTLLGTTYGGDGVNNFALPDLRGRVPVHQGQGPGRGAYALGQLAGTETVTLSPNQLPAHSHAFFATNTPASSAAPTSALQLGAVSGDTLYTNSTAGIASGDLASAAVGNAGSNQPHDNLMPTLTARYCIAWAGIFPSQG